MAFSLSEILFGCALVFSFSNMMISFYRAQPPPPPPTSSAPGGGGMNLMGLERFFSLRGSSSLSKEEIQTKELIQLLSSSNEDLQKALNLTWDLLKSDADGEEDMESLEDDIDEEGHVDGDRNATAVAMDDGEEDDPADEEDGEDMPDMDVDVDTAQHELMVPADPDDPNAAGASVKEDIGDVVPSLDEYEDDGEPYYDNDAPENYDDDQIKAQLKAMRNEEKRANKEASRKAKLEGTISNLTIRGDDGPGKPSWNPQSNGSTVNVTEPPLRSGQSATINITKLAPNSQSGNILEAQSDDRGNGKDDAQPAAHGDNNDFAAVRIGGGETMSGGDDNEKDGEDEQANQQKEDTVDKDEEDDGEDHSSKGDTSGHIIPPPQKSNKLSSAKKIGHEDSKKHAARNVESVSKTDHGSAVRNGGDTTNGGGEEDDDDDEKNHEDNELLRQAMDGEDEESHVAPINNIKNKKNQQVSNGSKKSTPNEEHGRNDGRPEEDDDNKNSINNKPWLVLHVGPRETGSSRIQTSLIKATKGSKLQKELERDGWQGVTFSFTKIQHIVTECFQKQQQQEKDCSEWEHLVNELSSAATLHNKHIIFSSETFSKIPSMDDEHTTLLFRQLLEKFRVRIVLVYQPLHVWLWTMYVKKVQAEIRKETNRRAITSGSSNNNNNKIATFGSFVHDRRCVETDPLATYERFSGIYGAPNVVVLHTRNNNERALVTDFVCHALPNATKTCQHLKNHRPPEEDNKTLSYLSHDNNNNNNNNNNNPVQQQWKQQVDHNRIVVEAYRKQLVGSKVPRQQALQVVEKYRAQEGGSKYPLVRIPLTSEDESWLWNRTSVAEQSLLHRNNQQKRHTLNNTALQQSFVEYREKYFASVDVSATLKLKTWKDVFKRLKSKD